VKTNLIAFFNCLAADNTLYFLFHIIPATWQNKNCDIYTAGVIDCEEK
jgi:hypothetical protein